MVLIALWAIAWVPSNHSDCNRMLLAGPDAVDMTEPQGQEFKSSAGFGSSFIEPCTEAACTRQQLLLAISLLKHLAYNRPDAGEALTDAGVMDTIRRYCCAVSSCILRGSCWGAIIVCVCVLQKVK